MFLTPLFNIIFPKAKRPLIVDFIGPYGVGKTYLLKKIHFKYNPCVQTKNFAIGLFRLLKMTYPEAYQKMERELKKGNLSSWHQKYLTGELCARCLDRIFYIDESVVNTFPIEILEKLDQEHPELLSEFYHNTIVIYLTDTLPNIQEKLKLRSITLKRDFIIKKADNNFYDMDRRVRLLEKHHVPILTLDANAPTGENIARAKAFIKKYRNLQLV